MSTDYFGAAKTWKTQFPASFTGFWAVLVVAAVSGRAPQAQEPSAAAPAEISGRSAEQKDFQFLQQVELPAQTGAAYCDFTLTVSVFDAARVDLGDLRLYDADGKEVPYALRILRSEKAVVPINAREFNRTHSADGTAELSIDLGEQEYEHNEVQIRTSGENFRRRAKLEGSADGQEWRQVTEKNLVKFSTASGRVNDDRLTYPFSRFRYLRVLVAPDAVVDRGQVRIDEVIVRRTIDVPGEEVTFTAQFGPRQPVRTGSGVPGSAWEIELGGRNVPCENLLVDVSDREFNREYAVASLGTDEGYSGPFWMDARASGSWRRVASDKPLPMKADLGPDFLGQRLKLTITDHANPALDVTGAKYSAAARQIVFARRPSLRGPLKLYFGNPAVLPPEYDFARNLPRTIDPAPQRLTLGERQTNPDYVPPPKPLSERWPWLIYVVLGAVCLVLALLLAGIARSAIAQHDAQTAPAPGPLA
jgi:hypothetical protein